MTPNYSGELLTDLRAEVANLAVVGENASTQFISPDKVWMRNYIPLRLSGKQIDIYQHPIALERESQLRGKWLHTTTVFVRNVRSSEQRACERMVTDLCPLLSFATMSQVRPFAYNYAGHWRRWNGEGIVSQWRAPIDLDGGCPRPSA